MRRFFIVMAVVTMGALGVTTAPAGLADTSSASGDLAVTFSTPGPVLSGTSSTYTITVTNTATVTAWGVQIMNTLPGGMKFGALINPDVCGRTNKPILSGTAFNCTGGDIAPGASVSVSYTATAPAPGTYSDTASVSGTVGGTWTGFVLNGGTFERNSDTLAIQVLPGATDAQVTGSASTGSPAISAPFTYTFQVKNNGPLAAYDVALDDVAASTMTLTSASSDVGTCTVSGNSTMHCDLGILGVGGQARIVLAATAPSQPGGAVNTATVSMSGPDRNPANNSATVTVQAK